VRIRSKLRLKNLSNRKAINVDVLKPKSLKILDSFRKEIVLVLFVGAPTPHISPSPLFFPAIIRHHILNDDLHVYSSPWLQQVEKLYVRHKKVILLQCGLVQGNFKETAWVTRQN
jgi:hypothetical protein